LKGRAAVEKIDFIKSLRIKNFLIFYLKFKYNIILLLNLTIFKIKRTSMATINNTVTSMRIDDPGVGSSVPKQQRSLQEIFLKYLPNINPLEDLGVSSATLKRFGLDTKQDLEAICVGLQAIKGLEKQKQHFEAIRTGLPSSVENPHSILEEIVIPLKEFIEGLVFNEDKTLKESILSPQCHPVDLGAIFTRAEALQKTLVALLGNLNNLGPRDLRDPDALRDLLGSLLEHLQEMRDLEREKVTKEISAYTSQIAIGTIWKMLNESEMQITTLHSLQEIKGFAREQLYRLEGIPEFNQKAEYALEKKQEELVSEEQKGELVPFTDIDHRLSPPYELIYMIIFLWDRPDICARVCKRLRALVFDKLFIEALLEQRSQKMEVSREDLYKILRIISSYDRTKNIFSHDHVLAEVSQKTGVSRADLLYKIFKMTSPYDQTGKNIFVRLREAQLTRAKALKVEVAKKGMEELESELACVSNEQMKTTGITPIALLIETINTGNVFLSLWVIHRFKDVITTKELEEYIAENWKMRDRFGVPKIVSEMPEVVYQIMQLLDERARSTGIPRIWNPSDADFWHGDVFLGTLSEALCEQNDFDSAIKIASSITDAQHPWVKLGRVYRANALAKIAVHLFKNGDIDKGWELALSIKNESPGPDPFYVFSQMLLSYGRVDNALDYIPLSGSEWHQYYLYSKSVKAFLKKGELDKALDVIVLIKDDTLQSQCAKKLVEAFLERGEPDQALKAVLLIKDQWEQSRIFEKILEKFLEKSELDKALEATLLIESLEKCDRVKKILQAFSEKNELERALEIAYAVKEDPIMQNFILSDISIKLFEKGDIDGALRVAYSMIEDDPERSGKDYHRKANTLGEISIKLFEKGEIDRAWNVAETIKDTYVTLNNNPLSQLSKKLLSEDKKDHALDVARLIKDRDSRSKAFSMIAEAFLEKGAFDTALTLLKSAQHDLQGRTSCAEKLAKAFLEKGELGKAVEGFSLTNSYHGKEQFPIGGALIEAFLKRGQLDKAFDIAHLTIEKMEKHYYLPTDESRQFAAIVAGLSQALLAEGKPDKVKELEQLLAKEKQKNSKFFG
jgi:hypothetical protein